MRIETKNLFFEINDQANQASFTAPGTGMECVHGDFWQLTLQDRERQVDEISVYSCAQRGTTRQDADGTIHIIYDRLTDEYGDIEDIRLEVTIWKECGLIKFKTRVENNQPGLRVLESRCPIMRFHRLCGKPEDDILYIPAGLGKRIKNPWAQNTQYMNDYAHSQHDYVLNMIYPGDACMAWLGLETGGKFFYTGRHDENISLCAFRVSVPHPMLKTRQMMITVAHLPAAQPGETVESSAACIGLLDCDWRGGAEIYRAFAKSSFYQPRLKQEWVRHMHGWQRINRQLTINKYETFSFESLPRLYLEGRKYGIDTILFFNWWDTPFEAGDPITDISPEGIGRLKAAIMEVRRLGGRVITECNGTYVVTNTPYYNEFGKEVAHLDMHGNEDLALHTMPGISAWGMPPRHYLHGCCGSSKWRDTLIDHAKLMKEFNPDGMFYDCFGAWSCQPCYNARHDHGNRVDEQWTGRRKVFEAVRDICGEEQALSNEVVTDIAACYSQVIHTLAYNLYDSYYDFPYLFRYTFPDVIITNRFINREAKGFDKQLRYDFMIGMRYDVGEIYGYDKDRRGGEHYAQIIGEMNSLRAQYADFMMDGVFTVLDTSSLPQNVYRTEYEAEDGRLLRILYNASDSSVEANGVRLQPDEIRFDVFPSIADYTDTGDQL